MRSRSLTLAAAVLLVGGAAFGLARALASTVPPAPGKIDPVQLSETALTTSSTQLATTPATAPPVPSVSDHPTPDTGVALPPEALPAEAPPVTVPPAAQTGGGGTAGNASDNGNPPGHGNPADPAGPNAPVHPVDPTRPTTPAPAANGGRDGNAGNNGSGRGGNSADVDDEAPDGNTGDRDDEIAGQRTGGAGSVGDIASDEGPARGSGSDGGRGDTD